MNKTAFCCLCIAMILPFLGCGESNRRKESAKASTLQLHQASVSPTSLFNEHTRALAPHFGVTYSGAVQIECAAPEKGISYGYEIWKNGEIIRPINWYGASFPDPFSGKITVSLEDVSEYTDSPKMKLVFGIVDHSSWTHHSTYLAKHKPSDGRAGPKQLAEPIIVSDGEEVAVWGYMAGNVSGMYSREKSINDIAKRVEWAIVMKIRIGKEPH